MLIIAISLSIYFTFIIIGLFGIAENKRAQGIDDESSD